MDSRTKQYIDSLTIDQIPWGRMYTAYAVASNFGTLLHTLTETEDPAVFRETFRALSDMEHQSTLTPPAPFVTVFLVRILDRERQRGGRSEIAETILHVLSYYLEICNEYAAYSDAEPLPHFADILDEQYLLPENCTDDDLEEIFEDPDSLPETLFASFYYYTKQVLLLIPELQEQA